jgi:carbon storage regulator
MLVLSRKRGESLIIDDKIRVVVQRVVGNRVTLGIEAPDDVHILRGELQLHLDRSTGTKREPALSVE